MRKVPAVHAAATDVRRTHTVQRRLIATVCARYPPAAPRGIPSAPARYGDAARGDFPRLTGHNAVPFSVLPQ